MIKKLVKKIFYIIFAQEKIFVKQYGYFFLLRRNIKISLLRLFSCKVFFLPTYINKKGRPKYLCHSWDPCATEVFLTEGFVDWGLEKIFYHSIKPGGCLVDVGAHTGYFSHLLYDKFSHFINIETSKKCQSLCLIPNEVNWEDKVVHNVNLPAFDKDNVEIYIQQHLHGFGKSETLGHETGDRVISEDLMRTIKIDSLYARLELSNKFKNTNINGIKIDVDGCDSEVLRGAVESIKRFRPVIYMESFSADDFDFLKNLDYIIYTMVCDERNPRLMEFASVPSSNFLSNIFYKMCIATPASNNCISLFDGMKRDNHDRKHLFIDV